MNLLGARRVGLRLRGLECLQRLIVRDLSGVAVLEKLPLPVFLGLAPRHLGIRLCDLGFGDLEVLPVLLRVEPRQKLALLDLRPDIDRPFEDLAVDSKADIGLVAGFYLAGQRDRLPGFAGFDRHGANGPDIRRRGLFFFVAGR